jgi:hypothetical protein
MRRGVKLGIGIPLAIVGTLLGLSALVLLAYVGFDGTFTTPRTSIATDTHAIVISTSFVDEDLRSGDVDVGSVTLDVDGRREIFIGVAHAVDVAAYLDGVAHAEATDVSYPGGDVALRRVGGSEEPTPPTDEAFWTASRTGDGELSWDLDEGDWSIVVMNADGSRRVAASGTVTARIPLLGTAIVVLLVLCLPLLIGGIAMVVSALRQRPDDRRGGQPGDRRGTPSTPAPARRGAPTSTGRMGSVPPRPDLPGERPDV